MVADTNENVTIPEGKNIVIDVNGKGITSDEDGTIVVEGKLNIKDSGEGESGEISSSTGAAIKVAETGDFTLGTNESEPNVSTTKPVVSGESYGVEVADNGEFSFFDGEISGKINAINGDDVNTPDNSQVDNVDVSKILGDNVTVEGANIIQNPDGSIQIGGDVQEGAKILNQPTTTPDVATTSVPNYDFAKPPNA